MGMSFSILTSIRYRRRYRFDVDVDVAGCQPAAAAPTAVLFQIIRLPLNF